jgi:thymidylate synthase
MITNTIDTQYQELLKDILENGVEKETRSGKTLSVFGRQIRYKFKDGKFPLLTTKKMYFKGIVTELLWFLRGDTSIEYLLKNDCHIWDGDCYRAYFLKTKELTLENLRVPYQKIHLWGTISGTISNAIFRPYSQDEFIERIKTNSEFAEKWGDLGPIYGKQWRNWTKYKTITKFKGFPETEEIWKDGDIDQIANLIQDLKTNPDSRRLMVNAWNVADIDSAVLPPCHYGFQVYTRELSEKEKYRWYAKKYNEDIDSVRKYFNIVNLDKPFTLLNGDIIDFPKRAISLMWNQRSVDTGLGLPFNIASYALLLEILAKTVNMIPDELIGNLGDTHIYSNQIEGIKEQLTREPFELPIVKISDRVVKDISRYNINDFILENYRYHSTIKMPLSN